MYDSRPSFLVSDLTQGLFAELAGKRDFAKPHAAPLEWCFGRAAGFLLGCELDALQFLAGDEGFSIGLGPLALDLLQCRFEILAPRIHGLEKAREGDPAEIGL